MFTFYILILDFGFLLFCDFLISSCGFLFGRYGQLGRFCHCLSLSVVVLPILTEMDEYGYGRVFRRKKKAGMK